MNECYGGVDYIGLAVSSNEPAVFEINAPMDKKFVYDFQKFNYLNKQVGSLLFNCIAGGLCLLAGAAVGSVFTMLMGVLCIAFPFVMFNKAASDSVRNAYHSGNSNIFRFYGDYFINRDYFALSVIPYGVVTEGHETKEYFFLYYCPGRAYVIPKGCFVSGVPEEMSRMLSVKLGNRFIVHR